MRIAFDIGGVISKYPKEFGNMMFALGALNDIFVITDMHDREEVLEMLEANSLLGVCVREENVYHADYKTYGEMCKAVLLRDLKIDALVDDFPGYLQWDSSFGPAPIRLQVMPDAFRPYWHDDWKVKCDSDFGRRKYTERPSGETGRTHGS